MAQGFKVKAPAKDKFRKECKVDNEQIDWFKVLIKLGIPIEKHKELIPKLKALEHKGAR